MAANPGSSDPLLAFQTSPVPDYYGGNSYSGALQANAIVSTAGGIIQAIGGYYALEARRAEAKSQALSLEFQAEMSQINARTAELQAQAILEAGQQQVGAIGLAYGQEKASQRASTAGRGIAVGVGSSAEVAASLEYAKRIDERTASVNSARQAAAARTGSVNASNAALLSRTSAGNLRRSAGSISPVAGAATNLLASSGYISDRWLNYYSRR